MQILLKNLLIKSYNRREWMNYHECVLVILFTLWFHFIKSRNKSKDAKLRKIQNLQEELNVYVLIVNVYSE